VALRLKTVWFKNAGGRSSAEVATVLASTIWRLADAAVADLSRADCDIVTPERGVRILGEVAAFLLHMSDRMVYGRVPEAERADLVQATARRLAEMIAANIREMGGAEDFDYRANFIDFINRRSTDYATFDCAPDQPSFPLLRYLGLAVRELMLESDQPWVADQIMDIQAPEALGMLKKTIDGLLSPAQAAPRRRTVAGD
jgi:hypothetical protein